MEITLEQTISNILKDIYHLQLGIMMLGILLFMFFYSLIHNKNEKEVSYIKEWENNIQHLKFITTFSFFHCLYAVVLKNINIEYINEYLLVFMCFLIIPYQIYIIWFVYKLYSNYEQKQKDIDYEE